MIDIERNFKHHPPNDKQVAEYEAIRSAAKQLALTLEAYCPESRELSLAFTNLEQSVFWANASIARENE